MKLYNLAAGMNPRRVRIFLAEKNITVDTVDIDMEKKQNTTPEFLTKNPMGTLPVLELDDGSYLSESIAICRYFDSVQPEPPLFGTDPLDQARVEMWNRRMEMEILVNVSSVFRHTHPFWIGRVDQIEQFGEQARVRLLQRMDWLDSELADREFIAGNSYTVADITAQCAFIVAKACKIRIVDEQENLARWFKTVSARPTSRA